MAVLKCKMCGGDIQATDNTYGTCESCGSAMTLPRGSDERKANLFNRANHFRRLNEFDKAVRAYDSILNEDDRDAEAHWGILLSRYGIEYIEDPVSHEPIPTCHRVQSNSILADADYLAVLEYTPDEYTKSLYEEEARKISKIQKDILAISSKEEPYDVFICYKETATDGSRTKDSTIAQDIYYQLTNDGYKVFFAKITLEDKLGQQYEPYIFNALNSAKVMLVIGTYKEYFDAIWVKNEWRRYLEIMKKDSSRLLIPCYRDMDAYDIPDELSNLQSQDMSKVGFMQDILRGVKKVLNMNKMSEGVNSSVISGIPSPVPGVESLSKRGYLFLEDAEWRQADEYFEKVLDIDPEYAPAYIGKLCIELKIKYVELLGESEKIISTNSNFKKAIRFADTDYYEKIEQYNTRINERFQQKLYDELMQRKSRAVTESECQNLANEFLAMGGYRNSDELAHECGKQYCMLRKRRKELEERQRELEERQRKLEERQRELEEQQRERAEKKQKERVEEQERYQKYCQTYAEQIQLQRYIKNLKSSINDLKEMLKKELSKADRNYVLRCMQQDERRLKQCEDRLRWLPEIPIFQ